MACIRGLDTMARPQQGFGRASARSRCTSTLGAASVQRRRLVCYATVDPLILNAQSTFQAGKSFLIHSPEQLQSFTVSEKLTVLMAKSSHCRPCKKFLATYHALAEQFKDSQLLEIVGDENPVTRKMMVDMKVKVTPTFFLYRDSQLLTSLTGTGRGQLRKAIVERLLPTEAGKDFVEPVLETVDSDDE